MTMSLPHRIGRVDLTVASLERATTFYEEVIGLRRQGGDRTSAVLGAGDRELLRLVELPGARPAHRAAGLYHFALLLPSRRDLALSLDHLHRVNAPISGYADHAVSEAIYLTDPDGHGIEIYRDRPRADWSYPQGQLRMTVEPLDVAGIMAELPAAPIAWSGLPDETIMGHIHLQVSDIAATEAFYTRLLGFDVVTRYGPSATFLSQDGYHHHIGANTWAGAGQPTAPPDAARLLSYAVRLDPAVDRDALARRLSDAGHPVTVSDGALVTEDPSGITIRLLGAL
jgi:catechol 2,3-dioxygenase